MSSNPTERSQSRGREPLYVRLALPNLPLSASPPSPSLLDAVVQEISALFQAPANPRLVNKAQMTLAPPEDASSPTDAKRYVSVLVHSPLLLSVEDGETDESHQVTTTGRGGAGNLRSQSREARAVVEDVLRLERQYTRERDAKQPEQIVRTPILPPCSLFPPLAILHQFTRRMYTDVKPFCSFQPAEGELAICLVPGLVPVIPLSPSHPAAPPLLSVAAWGMLVHPSS